MALFYIKFVKNYYQNYLIIYIYRSQFNSSLYLKFESYFYHGMAIKFQIVIKIIETKNIIVALMVLSQDQIKFITAIVVSVPLSYYMRKLPSTQIRYLYSFILGTALQLYVYGLDIWMPFLIHLIVYAIIKLKGRNCGALITGITIVSLSIYHIQRMIVDYGSWTLDISTILMCMVCKYSLFAYSYQDGAQSKQNLTPHQQTYKIAKLPSLYRYLVYCQFLPTSIIGTVTEYKDFEDFMDIKAPFVTIPQKQIAKKVAFEFLYSIACGAFYILHVIFFPLSVMKDPNFANQSPLYILYFSFFSVSFIRFKYYFGWKLSQCAVHASGISYNQEGKFERVKTCNPWIVETTVHLRQKVANWNISAQLWLRRCIYERAPFKNKEINQGYTIAISAFWHGFYGGYYLSFFFWFLQINLAQKVFKFTQNNQNHWLIKLFNQLGKFGDVILWILVNFLFSHNGLYFQILDSTIGWEILKKVYFVPPILVVAGIYYFSKLGKRPKPPKVKVDSQQAKTAKPQ